MMICHLGLCLTYWVLCGFFNESYLELAEQVLRIRHGPIPWLFPKTIAVAEIDQVFYEEYPSGAKNSRMRTYRIYAWLRTGRKRHLLSVPELSEAAFIEEFLTETMELQGDVAPSLADDEA